MVSKQLRISTDSLTPLFRASVGFDRLVNEMFENTSFANGSGYPPYNISKDANDIYEITLALAGFKKDDIELELADNTLKISGRSAVLDDSDGVEYLHKGIAERNFIRTFKLAEYVEVKSAVLEDGILKVKLFRNVPEALKPQKIKIS